MLSVSEHRVFENVCVSGITEQEDTLRLSHQISVSQSPGRNPNFNRENILSVSRNNNLRDNFKHTFLCLLDRASS